MHDSVSGDFKPEVVVLFFGGQDPVNEEISGFKMVGFESELLDRVPSGLIPLGPGEPNKHIENP